MKKSMISMGLASALVLGLSACGGGGGGTPTVTKFNGTWKGDCEASTNSRSFKQVWKINSESLDNDISVWRTPNCQPGDPVVVNAKATVEYQNEINVANTCAGGKAQEVKVDFVSIKVGATTITGEQNIRNALIGQNIGSVLPKYNLVCLDANGKLRQGLLTADKDGSTPAKRPTEMDPVKSFAP